MHCPLTASPGFLLVVALDFCVASGTYHKNGAYLDSFEVEHLEVRRMVELRETTFSSDLCWNLVLTISHDGCLCTVLKWWVSGQI